MPTLTLADAIAKTVQSAGYRTTMENGQVVALDPVHSLRAGMAVITGHKRVIIRDIFDAIKFINDRA